MNTTKRYSPEVRERAVRMVLEHRSEYDSEWAAIGSISQKIGCTAETLRKWVRRANEILRKASAYFAQAELDRRVK
jgi:transposase-like protein